MFIEKVFKEVLEDLNADEKVISQYFSPNYIQHVDGHTLNYSDFVQHMKVQKTMLDSCKVSIQHYVREGNTLCTVHQVDAVKKNGCEIAVLVISYIEVENGKITLCNELTRLLKGAKEDQEIGSIY